MNSDTRLIALQSWLATRFADGAFALAPASEDASFRRYFRVSFADGRAPLIAMDAPPGKEDCRPFLHVAGLFATAGAHVPRVHAENLAEGFLLLEDLGGTTYLEHFNAAGANPVVADSLYAAAIDALISIQRSAGAAGLAPYDRTLLERELALFPDWYVARHLGAALAPADAQLLAGAFEVIVANNLAQPRVHVHRDYHSRNLMVCEPLPGVLDFQDAVHGPITYDLVSLLKDAYIGWDEHRVIDWCVRYWEKARKAALPVHADFAVFYRDFEWMGVQRHLKVAGIFARLAHRDGKHGYLADLPLVLDYLGRACARYRELGPLAGLLDRLHERRTKVGYTF
jgi:aminoglycoside/choline kinase family phosphotransferase